MVELSGRLGRRPPARRAPTGSSIAALAAARPLVHARLGGLHRLNEQVFQRLVLFG